MEPLDSAPANRSPANRSPANRSPANRSPANRSPANRETGDADSHAICHIDGAARGNPGPASFGVAFYDGRCACEDPWLEWGAAIGHATNNTAEYHGLLAALTKALELGIRSLTVRSDSQLLIRQMTGQYRVREPHLQVLHGHAKRLERCFDTVRFEHLPRHANKHADRLANQALDGDGSRPDMPSDSDANVV